MMPPMTAIAPPVPSCPCRSSAAASPAPARHRRPCAARHSRRTRPAKDVDQLTGTIDMGLPDRHPAIRLAESERRQQHVGQPHEGERHANRRAMVVGRDDDIDALDHVAEHAPSANSTKDATKADLAGCAAAFRAPQSESTPTKISGPMYGCPTSSAWRTVPCAAANRAAP